MTGTVSRAEGAGTRNEGGVVSTPPKVQIPILLGAYVVVVAAAVLAVRESNDADTVGLSVATAEGFSVLGPMFIVALALERAFEPIMARVNTDVEKRALKQARADKQESEEVDAAERLRAKRSTRGVVSWAILTSAALLLCGWLDLGLLQAISSSDVTGTAHDIDVVVTGVAIGAGTKPLHDLISRVEKAKTNADPATKPPDKLPGTPSKIVVQPSTNGSAPPASTGVIVGE